MLYFDPERDGKGWDLEKKKFSFWSIRARPGIGNSRKIAKKNKKTSIWLLFKPKRDGRGWEYERKKNFVLIHSYPTRNTEFHKNSKEIQKIEKHHYGFFPSQNRMGQAENERKKKSFLSVASQSGIGISKKIAKKFQKLKNINMTSFQAKTRRERLRMWEKKNSRFDPFQPYPE